MSWSLALSTYSSTLLNWVTYCLNNSPSTYSNSLLRWPVGFLCLFPPMKWQTKPLLSCSKFAIVLGGILLNHTLAVPFSVIGNALHITSFRVIYNSISVLNDSMWSKGSLEPSYDSNCGRWNCVTGVQTCALPIFVWRFQGSLRSHWIIQDIDTIADDLRQGDV